MPHGVRRALLRQRLRKRHGLRSLGPEFDYWIADNNTFETGCRLGGPAYVSGSSFGAFSYVEVGCRVSLTDIGRFCSIGPFSTIGLADHPDHFVSTHPYFYRSLPHIGYDLVTEDAHQDITKTTLGHDVWIGHGVIVKGGVNIGHGAIIGAGSVVTRDVPPYAVVAGVPARVLRYRFDEPTIDALLASRWWDRDLEWLKRNADKLRDVEAFLAALEQ
ncbi:CatB-related O-acetyltransferase [Ruegeria sp. Ofav3-42]|uniref:CatB-related O-acetyltransferase n=1 Tax=Ruegeria sp. Ofav3-42 TaxID=2917759 RepID=UPI0021073C09|nr:CatB-related O-acetyltransferase [Ruegeria sp. Ofav3-42]